MIGTTELEEPVKKPIVFVIVIILNMIACQGMEEMNDGYSLEKVNEIFLDSGDSAFVCRITDMAIDRDGQIFLTDKNCHTIWVANAKGRFREQIGHKGRGPGELDGPVSIVMRGDTLVVLEAGNGRLSFFSSEGRYLYSFNLSRAGAFSALEISPRDTLIVSESLGFWNYDLYTISGKPITAHPETRPPGILMPVDIPGGQLSLAADGNILFSRPTRYQTVKINWRGDTLAIYSAKPLGYQAPDLGSRESIERQRAWSLMGPPLQLDTLILVQRLRKPDDSQKNQDGRWECFIDLFSSQGRPIQLGMPSPRLFLYAKEEKLYGVDATAPERGDRNPAIVVYRIVRN